jgi:hypothetical protein
MTERTYGFNTLAIHAGAQPDPATGARATPIYQTTSYVFEDVQHASDLFALRAFGNIYTRIMNPTQAVLESKIAALEGGTAALAVASGHAAQFIAFHTLMRPGDEFIAARQLYGGSINQFNHSFKSFGWHVVWADIEKPETLRGGAVAEDQGDLRGIDRQSRRPHHRPRGHRQDRPQGARAAHRRQHAGHALPVQALRARRRHRRAFADQVHGRARQLGRRRDRRRRHIRLGPRRQVPDAERAQRVLQRHQALRDLRQHRLCHHLPGHRPARLRPRDLAVQRLPDPHRHGDLEPAHAAPVGQCAEGGAVAEGRSQSRLGQLCRARGRPGPQAAAEIQPQGRGRGLHLRPQGRLRRRRQARVGREAVVASRQCRRHPLADHPPGLDDPQPAVARPAQVRRRRPRRGAPVDRPGGRGRHHRRPRRSHGKVL